MAGLSSVLLAEAGSTGRRITEVAVGEALFRSRMSKAGLLDQLVAAYDANGCDGLFLPAISNLGLRLPYAEMIAAVRTTRPVRFVVIDGAQDLCHVPTSLGDSGADVYIAGCHKWMQAYLPMRLAICAAARMPGLVTEVTDTMLRQGLIDDPLLRFTRQLETDELDPFTETANLLPMFSCAAAVAEQLKARVSPAAKFDCQLDNARILGMVVADTGWEPLLPVEAFRSAIVLMRSRSPSLRSLGPDQLRGRFHHFGVSLSAYEGGVIRLSMPTRPFKPDELDVLESAFAALDGQERDPVGIRSIGSRSSLLAASS